MLKLKAGLKMDILHCSKGELMNIKVGDRVLYKCLAATSIGIVQKILSDSYYIINGMVIYSFEILKKL